METFVETFENDSVKPANQTTNRFSFNTYLFILCQPFILTSICWLLGEVYGISTLVPIYIYIYIYIFK